MSPSPVLRFVLVLPALLAAVMVAGVQGATALVPAPLHVTKTADTDDGTCDSDCSLREAVIVANSTAARDTILVPSGTYRLSQTGAGEENAALGDLDITHAVTIRGQGAANTGIRGLGADRVFDIQPGASATISGLAIQGGNPGDAPGGGILANGNLTLRRVVLFSNTASTGGGVYKLSSGNLSITGSKFLANHAVGGSANPEGGGLRTLGPTTIFSTTFTQNTATEGAGAKQGGAIQVLNTSLTLSNSTVVDNTAVFVGGISGTNASLTLNNDTIAGNTATSSESAGGIDHFSFDGNKFVTMGNTIVAGNDPVNCRLTANTMTSQGHNLDTGTSCELNGIGDRSDTPAGLTQLAANGGPTPTMALTTTSAALNHGGGNCESKDQRGVTRPQGAACDIGAYEMPLAIVTRPTVSTVHHRTFTVAWNAPHAGPGTAAFDVRFRQRAIGAPGFGAFHTFRNDTTARSATFTGEFGRQYCFSARAIDAGGHSATFGPERCVRVTH